MRFLVVLATLCALASEAGAVGERFKVKLKKPAHGFQMRAAPYVVPVGQDLEWCEYRRLKNPHEMLVQGFDIRMSYGAHHFVVWAYNGPQQDDSKFPTAPVLRAGCVGLSPGEFIPTNLFGMQTPNGSVRFPPGIATRLKPHQQVWLNPHIKNFGTTDVTPQIVFNMTPARKGSVQHIAESFAIGENQDIRIPAGGRQTLVGEWTAPANLNIIQFSSHQHQWGTHVTGEIEQADGSFQKIFENSSWEHPFELWTHKQAPWKDLDPPVLRLEAGRRIRFTCQWNNQSTSPVTFGTEVDNEMCFVTGYYYRDDGAPTGALVGQGCLPSVEGLTCPFAANVSSVTE